MSASATMLHADQQPVGEELTVWFAGACATLMSHGCVGMPSSSMLARRCAISSLLLYELLYTQIVAVPGAAGHNDEDPSEPGMAGEGHSKRSSRLRPARHHGRRLTG